MDLCAGFIHKTAMSNRPVSSEPDHYDHAYFAWQKQIGEFGAWAHVEKFQPYISENDRVLDFGCGGGYVLEKICCRKRFGVEISPHARRVAEEKGIKTVQTASEIPDASIDVVISNNALEHTHHPLSELQAIQQTLKPSGKAVFVVPCESISKRYKPNNINHHLYSWSPMCIGNLFTEAGFQLISTQAIYAKWPPYFYQQIAKYGGKSLFKLSCEIYGRLDRSWFQVKVVAQKNRQTEKL